MARSQKIPALSIIIPTLNEADHLPLLLADLNEWPYNFELIIVDGGSIDLTISIAQIQGIDVIKSSKKNRGYQLKIGASNAKGDWLLFLHADSRLSPSWFKSLSQIIQNKKSENFAWYFDFKIKKNNLEFRFLEIAVALRSHFLQYPYGDQGRVGDIGVTSSGWGMAVDLGYTIVDPSGPNSGKIGTLHIHTCIELPCTGDYKSNLSYIVYCPIDIIP